MQSSWRRSHDGVKKAAPEFKKVSIQCEENRVQIEVDGKTLLP